ncbi:hypothetical protein [Azonexus hydrophilus]|nr:hypothetical protein [Azonexus hydrophilus]
MAALYNQPPSWRMIPDMPTTCRLAFSRLEAAYRNNRQRHE